MGISSVRNVIESPALILRFYKIEIKFDFAFKMQLKIYLFIFLTNSEIQNKYSKQKHKQTEQTGIVQVENIEEGFMQIITNAPPT